MGYFEKKRQTHWQVSEKISVDVSGVLKWKLCKQFMEKLPQHPEWLNDENNVKLKVVETCKRLMELAPEGRLFTHPIQTTLLRKASELNNEGLQVEYRGFEAADYSEHPVN